MADKTPLQEPWHVRLVGVKDGPGFVMGYPDEVQAKASAGDRNNRAESLGIKARYEVVPKP